MPYEYLEGVVTADEAFRAWGSSLEETFSSAADALLGIMIKNPDELKKESARVVEIEDETLEFLLYSFLKEILYIKDTERLLLRPENIEITKSNGKWHLKALMIGESIDNKSSDLLVDVKAITLHQFYLSKTKSGWETRVVVDI